MLKDLGPLLAKLAALVDEVTGLVREERQRRALKVLSTPPGPTVNPPVVVPFAPYVPSRTAPPAIGDQPWVPPYEITCGGGARLGQVQAVGHTFTINEPPTLSWNHVEITCAPNPFANANVSIGETLPNPTLYGNH